MRHTTLVAAVAGVLVAGTASAATPGTSLSIAGADAHPGLVIVDGQAQPVFSGDPGTWIQGRAWVQVPTDSDRDGRPDRVLVRFARAKDGPPRAPVIMEASPYWAGVNPVKNHDVDHDLYHPPATGRNAGGVNPWAAKTWITRGFAWAEVDSIGTGGSTGCPTTGGRAETLGVKAVIDWLNGRAPAVDAAGAPVRAAWASGAVGMIGTSYDGTLPNAVATTGVEGLKAIIPISAISDWYSYYRAGGAVVAPEGYQGEDADILAKFVLTRTHPEICRPVVADLARRQDRRTGDMSAFWRERSYLADVRRVKAAVYVAHGLSDWNVKPSQAARWYAALHAQGTPTKLYWQPGGHGGPPPLAEQIRWFTRYVLGIRNGVENELPVLVAEWSGTIRRYAAWPLPGTTPQSVPLAEMTLRAGTPARWLTFTDRPDQTLLAFSAHPRRANGLAFASARLGADTRLSGFATASVRMSLGQDAANLSLAIVDLPPNGPPQLVTMGWADPQNRATLWRTDPITPGEPITVPVAFEATEHLFPAGHRIGVTILQTDHDFTIRPPAGNTMTIDTASSSVRLPLSSPPPAPRPAPPS
jgi:X-Pro dipeptidyl-peptidase